jgi:cytochrome b
MLQKILVWDIPTRVFHWLLAVSFTGAYLTAESERYRDLHLLLGYTLLGLILFRLVWGFAGTRYARFTSFLAPPGQVVAYLRALIRHEPEHHAGHNPAGAVAIFLLLVLGMLTAFSGILLYFEAGGEEAFEEVHEVFANGMLAIVIVHVAGVFVSSRLHDENLIRAMFTGYKQGMPEQAIKHSFAWLGAALIVAVVAFWVWAPRSVLLAGAGT